MGFCFYFSFVCHLRQRLCGNFPEVSIECFNPLSTHVATRAAETVSVFVPSTNQRLARVRGAPNQHVAVRSIAVMLPGLCHSAKQVSTCYAHILHRSFRYTSEVRGRRTFVTQLLERDCCGRFEIWQCSKSTTCLSTYCYIHWSIIEDV